LRHDADNFVPVNRPTADKVRWGVLGAAKIALIKVIPAMQRGEWSEITAIASRDPSRSREAADRLGIQRSYGSYEALLDDPDVEAVYIPLPNHLHVEWATRAAERGKHVLCEKPIALSAGEAGRLLEVRDRTGMMIQEAFMVRTHPQWQTAVDIARSGRLGEIRSVMGYFSYDNARADDIRNVAGFGGGALFDIGCYLVHTARWIIGREPERVYAAIDRDPSFGTDRLTSMLLDFGHVHAIGTCATQAVPYQRVHIVGRSARLEIEIPFNAPPNEACRLYIYAGASLGDAQRETIEIAPCDQYTLQGDAFSRAIRGSGGQPLPLEDSVANMRVIDRLFGDPGSS
jgi:predicted dehydrogenase